jgi:hypothetical protein
MVWSGQPAPFFTKTLADKALSIFQDARKPNRLPAAYPEQRIIRES